MFYVCQGCKAVCSAPCTICDAACKGCSQTCEGCNNFFRDALKPVLENPLGSYVVGTWAVMACVIFSSAITLSRASCSASTRFCLINIVLAALHSIVAFYFQRRLVNKIGTTYSSMTHKQMADSAKQVMGYDFVFCIYVFVFAASFFYNCQGIRNLGDCSGTGPAWAGAALMIMYGFGVFWYVMCWYGCNCCIGTVSEGLKTHPWSQNPEPAQVGITQAR